MIPATKTWIGLVSLTLILDSPGAANNPIDPSGLQGDTAIRSECNAFVASIQDPIRVSLDALNGEAIGGVPTASSSSAKPHYQLGTFIYRGQGFEATSRDKRFEGVIVTERGPIHRCGYILSAGLNVWDLKPTFPQMAAIAFKPVSNPAIKPNTDLAEGAFPALNGYRRGASWPYNVGDRRGYIGLMHPIENRVETLVVFFEPDQLSEPEILAKLPMAFQSVSVMPPLHSGEWSIHLWGRDETGPLRAIVLKVD